MIQITEKKLKEAIQIGLGQDGLCAELLTKGLIEQIKALAISRVVGRSEQLKCVWCGNDASKDILPKLCDDCFKKGCEAFKPEYYLFTKLDGGGYDGDYNEFINDDDYESYIGNIQSTIDEIKSLKFPLRIYRGLNEKEVDLLKFHQHESGNISWTHNLNVAKKFANGGVILTGVVNYDDVDIQATINRNVLHSVLYEDEIVLKDNKLIKNLKKLK